jgi:hypothetical protein
MHPGWRRRQRHLGGWADDEIVAAPDRQIPVRAADLMHQIFEPLVDGDRNEQEEDDVGHPAHHGGVAEPEPSDRRGTRAQCNRAAEAQQKRGGRGEHDQSDDDDEGPVERQMRPARQIAGEPLPLRQRGGIDAEGEHRGRRQGQTAPADLLSDQKVGVSSPNHLTRSSFSEPSCFISAMTALKVSRNSSSVWRMPMPTPRRCRAVRR